MPLEGCIPHPNPNPNTTRATNGIHPIGRRPRDISGEESAEQHMHRSPDPSHGPCKPPPLREQCGTT